MRRAIQIDVFTFFIRSFTVLCLLCDARLKRQTRLKCCVRLLVDYTTSAAITHPVD